MIQTLMLLTAIFLLLYTTEKDAFFNAVVLGQLGLYISRAIIIQYPLLLPDNQGVVLEMGFIIILGGVFEHYVYFIDCS